MSLGGTNNAAEVAKVQAFLKNTEGSDVDVTGIFDAKTDAAVRAFQNKYSTEVLAPWNVSAPTGVIYITTAKKINALACNSAMNLTPAEIAIINSYVNAQASASANTASDGSNTGSNQTGSVDTTPVGPANPVVGQTNDANANTAAVGNISLWMRFWNFIWNLFAKL